MIDEALVVDFLNKHPMYSGCVGPLISRGGNARDGVEGLVFQLLGNKKGKAAKVVCLNANPLILSEKMREQHKKQILRSFEVQKKLIHPNIVKAYEISDFPMDSTLSYIMIVIEMEYISKAVNAMEWRLNKFPYPDTTMRLWQWLVGLGDKIGRALEYIHSLPDNIVHRDVKPENIIIASNGEPYLTDFGDVQVGGVLPAGFEKRGSLGTAPPEQLKGKLTDPRADIYSLAATLYQLYVAGAINRRILEPHNEPIETVVSGVHPWFARVLGDALKENRDERYPTMRAFVDALEKLAIPSSTTQQLAAPPTKVLPPQAPVVHSIPQRRSSERMVILIPIALAFVSISLAIAGGIMQYLRVQQPQVAVSQSTIAVTTAIPTATSVPPTSTVTRVPPSPTATPVLPTATTPSEGIDVSFDPPVGSPLYVGNWKTEQVTVTNTGNQKLTWYIPDSQDEKNAGIDVQINNVSQLTSYGTLYPGKRVTFVVSSSVPNLQKVTLTISFTDDPNPLTGTFRAYTFVCQQ